MLNFLQFCIVCIFSFSFQTIASLIRYEYSFIQELVELVLDWGDENNLFMELSVKELVWGYEDNLLKKVNGILLKHNLTGINDTFGLFASVSYFNISSIKHFCSFWSLNTCILQKIHLNYLQSKLLSHLLYQTFLHIFVTHVF